MLSMCFTVMLRPEWEGKETPSWTLGGTESQVGLMSYKEQLSKTQ